MWSLPPSATVAMCASGSRISTSASASMSRAFTSPALSTRRYSVLVVVDVHLERNLLQVEDDVGRVLDHARDRRELVQHAVDLDRRDRRALDRGQQHAPQRVADRRAEAALERLRVEPAEPVGERLALELQPLRPLKTFPQHLVSSFRVRRPIPRAPPDLPFRSPPPAAGLGGCGPAGYVERVGQFRAVRTALTRRSPRASSAREPSYLQYSSTISCSCTGRLICSRVGSDAMRPVSSPRRTRATPGCRAPSPLPSRAGSSAFCALVPRTATTSPALTEYDGMSTLRPLTEEVAVAHELPRLRARGREAEPVDHVVEPPLEQLQQRLAGDAARAGRPSRSSGGTGSRARRRCA